MRVLLIGVGTVGEAIVRMAATRDWCEGLVLADYDVARARSLEAGLGESGKARIVVEQVDARDRDLVSRGRHASWSSKSMLATRARWPGSRDVNASTW